MSKYHITTRNFVCGIEVDESGVIIKTAPILKRFTGEHINNLSNWLDMKFGEDCTVDKLAD